MEEKLYKAAVDGDVKFLGDSHTIDIETGRVILGDDDYFLSRTFENNNILHIATLHGRFDFIEQALKILSVAQILTRQQNSALDTPLHIAARHGYKRIAELLVSEAKNGSSSSRYSCSDIDQDLPPWKVKNLEGNTPLHVALTTGKLELAVYLVSVDGDVACFVNNNDATPLHLAVQHCSEGYAKASQATREGGTGSRLSIIRLLLKIDPSAAYMRDKDGLTPLLRAASLKPCALPAIKAILVDCPQSAELRCDTNGRNRTVLHLLVNHNLTNYRKAKKLLDVPEIDALKDIQDCDGNTPAHLAIKSDDFTMARVLLDCSADFSIKSKDGLSADELTGRTNFFRKMKEETSKGMEKFMDAKLYDAAVKCDASFLDDNGSVDYLSEAPNGNNILHIALQYGFFNQESRDKQRQFVKNVLERFTELVYKTNSDGDTPFHVAARCRMPAAKILVDENKLVNQELLHDVQPPWRMKNVKGNTALHEALLANNPDYAISLVELDEDVLWYVNDSNETPLHILAKYGMDLRMIQDGKDEDALSSFNKLNLETSPHILGKDGKDDDASQSSSILNLLLERASGAVFLCDKDGLTPLLRAARNGQILVAQTIIEKCPQSIETSDREGRTFLHLLQFKDRVNTMTSNLAKKLLANPKVQALMSAQDYNGNTPLHLALKIDDSIMTTLLVEICLQPGDLGWEHILFIPNQDGETPFNLIISKPNVPYMVLLLVQIRFKDRAISWAKSQYGIHKEKLKDAAGALSVVAGLLVTITFAAAFTIPGGFNSQEGTPILLRKAAFLLFLLFDSIAICSSIFAVMSLLWGTVGGAGDQLSLALVDNGISSIQISIISTLLTFMAGVYAAIVSKETSLAIIVCVGGAITTFVLPLRFPPLGWLPSILERLGFPQPWVAWVDNTLTRMKLKMTSDTFKVMKFF
ncbi:hypothetical protein Ancab_007035 [Ancistrocladus abbreviatus]